MKYLYSSSGDNSDDDVNVPISSSIHDLDHIVGTSPPSKRWHQQHHKLKRSNSFRGISTTNPIDPSPRSHLPFQLTRTLSEPRLSQSRSKGKPSNATGFRGSFLFTGRTGNSSNQPPKSARTRSYSDDNNTNSFAFRQVRNGRSFSADNEDKSSEEIASKKNAIPPISVRQRAFTFPQIGVAETIQEDEEEEDNDNQWNINVENITKSFPPADKPRKVAFANSRFAYNNRSTLEGNENCNNQIEETKEEEALPEDYVIHGDVSTTEGEVFPNENLNNPKRSRTASSDSSTFTKRRLDSANLPYNSDTDFMDDDDTYDDEEAGMNSSVDTSLNSSHDASGSRKKPVRFLGLTWPFSQFDPSWNRVANFVVEKAPCFCCRRMSIRTYRSVLVRLNILAAVFSAGQLGSAISLFVIMRSKTLVDRNLGTETEQEIEDLNTLELVTNVWNLNGSIWFLGVLAFAMLVAITFTARALQTVSLAGAIRYLWLILWVLPLQIFFGIGLFDYFRVTEVWIKYWWRDRTMAWFRAKLCDPPEVANTLCAVPEFANEFKSTAWCLRNYNSIDCVAIRNAAQRAMKRFLYLYYYLNGAWCLCFVCLLFLVIQNLESMISRPLVQRSRESNVPAWLLLPTVGCISFGTLYAFSSTSGLNTRANSESEATWIGPLFMSAGGFFLLSSILAWSIRSFPILNSRHKIRNLFMIFGLIVISFALLIILTTLFSASIAFSLSLNDIPISDEARGDIACFLDQSGSCTGCNNIPQTNVCPEWSTEDVTTILQTQTKAGATLAAIFLVYAASNLRHAFNLRSRIVNYQIAYV